MLPPPPKNYKISSAFSYNFKSALTLHDLRRLRRKVLEAADGDEQIQTTEAMLDYLDSTQWQAEVTPDLFENLVERITVVSAEEVKFRLLNGLELAERLV